MLQLAQQNGKVFSRTVCLLTTMLFLSLFLKAQTMEKDSTQAPPPIQKNQKGKTVLFPAFSYAPETSVALGIAGMHFYKSSANAKLSQVNCNLLYTFNNQFINEAGLLHYTKENNYLLKATIGINKYPENFYGVGNKTNETTTEQVTYNSFKSEFAFLKKIKKDVYIGARYNYANYYHITSDKKVNSCLDTVTGNSGSINSGLGIAFIFDSRDNYTNTTKGWLLALDGTWNNLCFGADHNYFAMNADLRKFKQLHSGAVLALQGVLNIKEGEVPFTQLSYLGGSNIMRGFYAGRYRDKNLLAFQAEYRRKLIGKWGCVLFAGAGKVSNEIEELNLHELQHSLGFGFRRSITKKNKVNLRIDVGYGNGNSNFYINIAEAF